MFGRFHALCDSMNVMYNMSIFIIAIDKIIYPVMVIGPPIQEAFGERRHLHVCDL